MPNPPDDPGSPLTLANFQQLIRDMYLKKDIARGVDGTFMWLMEEIGELAAALRSGTHEEQLGEFADVLAWLATIANVVGVDLSEAVAQVRRRLPRLRPARLHVCRRREAVTLVSPWPDDAGISDSRATVESRGTASSRYN